jgi:hypothetical protein
MSAYTRDNPSPEYLEMVEMYSTLHQEGAESERKKDSKRSAEQTFPGKMLMEQATPIRDMIARTGSQSLLDYGCGKGEAYQLKDIELIDGETAPSLQDYWKLENIHCYDPGYEPFSRLPTEQFDGVICIDVLEHITEPDLGWVIDELFSHARRFVFATVACYPAKKHLPNGQNAHCTVLSPDGWGRVALGVAMRHTKMSCPLDSLTKTGPPRKLWGLYRK